MAPTVTWRKEAAKLPGLGLRARLGRRRPQSQTKAKASALRLLFQAGLCVSMATASADADAGHVVRCSPSGANCNATGCCQDEKLACYRKNDGWASCASECKPGVHLSDPEGFQTSWDCSVVPKICAAVFKQCGGKAANGKDPYIGPECCDGCTCKKQSEYYSQCMPPHSSYVACTLEEHRAKMAASSSQDGAGSDKRDDTQAAAAADPARPETSLEILADASSGLLKDDAFRMLSSRASRLKQFWSLRSAVFSSVGVLVSAFAGLAMRSIALRRSRNGLRAHFALPNSSTGNSQVEAVTVE